MCAHRFLVRRGGEARTRVTDCSSSQVVRELIGEPSGRGIYPDSPRGSEMWNYWSAWTDGDGLHDWTLRVQIKSDGTVASSDLVENK